MIYASTLTEGSKETNTPMVSNCKPNGAGFLCASLCREKCTKSELVAIQSCHPSSLVTEWEASEWHTNCLWKEVRFGIALYETLMTIPGLGGDSAMESHTGLLWSQVLTAFLILRHTCLIQMRGPNGLTSVLITSLPVPSNSSSILQMFWF